MDIICLVPFRHNVNNIEVDMYTYEEVPVLSTYAGMTVYFIPIECGC